MAERTTAKNVANVFATFCHVFGLRMAKFYGDKGGYAIDRYMGYKIVRFDEGGGMSEPFGARIRTASEMVQVMYFSMQVAEHLHLHQRHNPPRRHRRGAVPRFA